MTDAVDNRPTDQKELENWYKDQAAALDGKDPEDRSPGEERVMVVEGNDTSAYVGVDPMYQNYANETEKAHAAEADPDNPTPYVAEQIAAAGGLSTNDGAVVTGEDGADVEEREPEPAGDPEATGDGGSTASPEPTPNADETTVNQPPPPGPEGVTSDKKSATS